MCPSYVPMSPELAAAPSTPDELRDWLRHLKERSGASFAEIARSIGEEERTVKRWMTGAQPVVPRGDSLLKLLDFFGVAISPPPPDAIGQSISGEVRALRNDLFHSRPGVLTESERVIVDGIARGTSFSEVAAELGVTTEELDATLMAVGDRMKADIDRDRAARQDRLRSLEEKVDEVAQSTAESLARLASAIDELSALLRGEEPGDPGRKTAQPRR